MKQSFMAWNFPLDGIMWTLKKSQALEHLDFGCLK
jgi:hypothetical protein